MNILVIGANGFLGRNFVQKCLSKGWNVSCMYHDKKDNIPQTCKAYKYAHITTMKSSYDVVFLLAAMIPRDNMDRVNPDLIKANIQMPLTVCKKFTKSKIIFSSSVAVYGNHKSVISESSDFDNPNLYGLTKLAGETIVRFHPRHQIIRFSSVYGPGMYPGTFLPSMIREAKRFKRITVYGNGLRVQDYLHVDDAVGYLLAAATRDESGTYLGVYGSSFSNNETARIVERYVSGCTIRHVGKDGTPSFRYNNALTKKLLNYKPLIFLEKGIRDMITYE